MSDTYIFFRRTGRTGAGSFYVRLQPPGEKPIVKSLRTQNIAQARVTAGPYIERYSREQLARRPVVVTEERQRYAPRPEPYKVGDEKIVAGPNTLTIYSADGSVREEPNRERVGKVMIGDQVFIDPTPYLAGPDVPFAKAEKAAPKNEADEALWNLYCTSGGPNRTGLSAKARHDATVTWELFREITRNKPLAQCTRDDGRALVAEIQARFKAKRGRDIKSDSVKRQLKALVAVVNFGIEEGKLPQSLANPFVKVAPTLNDELERLPFDGADIESIKDRLDRMPGETPQIKAERTLLLRMLALTGMRLNEAFQIDREHVAEGVRYVEVTSRKGKDARPTKRRVPLPTALLKFLPAKITAPLFSEESGVAGGALRRFIRECGITDPAKVVHSFRHRAITILDTLDPSESYSRRITGHVKGGKGKDAHARYSHGEMRDLLKWINKITF